MPLLLRLARSRDIAAEVAERLAAGAGEEVVVASSGMAAAIAEELLSRLPNGVAGVRLQTLNDLARRIINDAGDYPRVAGDAERRLAMRTAARAIDDPMMESRGMAAMLERSYRDVRDSGVTLADFDARARRATLRNARRTQLVVRAWREYERLIAQSGAIDPADLLGRAAALVKRADVAPQIVAGFYDMTGAQLALVEALRDAGKLAAVLVPAGESDAYAFARPFIAKFAGAEVARAATLRIREPRVSVHAHETKLDELSAVCAEVRALLDDGVPPRSIGIVARALDEDDARLLARFANELGFATTATTSTPLLAHRLGRGLATILRLRDRGFPRGDVFELLHDGFTPRRRMQIDDVDLATRRARVAGGTASELQNVAHKLADYVAVVAELEQLAPPAVLRGSEWSETLASLASRFKLETDQDIEAANAIDEVCALFRRWPTTRFDTSLVIDALEQHDLPPAPCALRPVIATDVMSFRGRSVEHLFAVRMQDDLFPQRRVDDPLLPDSDRRELRLRQIGDGRDEERLLFELLFDAAGASVRFSYAGGDGFGKVLRKSAFLRAQGAGGGAQMVPSREHHLRPAPCAPRPDRALQLLAKSGTQSNFDGYLTHPPPLPSTISPTQLEDFGECPQKFLIKHLLGARDIDDPDRELQLHHREKGKLDHKILERFYRTLSPEELARAEPLLARLHAIVDDAFDALDIESPPFNRTMRDLERRATKRILGDFVARDLADLAASGLAPIEFESRFGPFTIQAHDVPIKVEGTIDRIDAGDRRYRIVDYKSGKALRHKDLDAKIDRGVRLQLALYAMAAAERFGVAAGRVSGTIKPLVPGGAKPEKYAFELAAKAPRLHETLDLFVAAIVGGAFPAFPNDNDDQFNSCKYCPVNHSCRTKHDAEQRFAVQQFKDPRTLLQR
jgi:ATP-dependent helicase/DNAse subunit B